MRSNAQISRLHTSTQVPSLIMAIHLTTAKRPGALGAL